VRARGPWASTRGCEGLMPSWSVCLPSPPPPPHDTPAPPLPSLVRRVQPRGGLPGRLHGVLHLLADHLHLQDGHHLAPVRTRHPPTPCMHACMPSPAMHAYAVLPVRLHA
jgi:hypothetical protein